MSTAKGPLIRLILTVAQSTNRGTIHKQLVTSSVLVLCPLGSYRLGFRVYGLDTNS